MPISKAVVARSGPATIRICRRTSTTGFRQDAGSQIDIRTRDGRPGSADASAAYASQPACSRGGFAIRALFCAVRELVHHFREPRPVEPLAPLLLAALPIERDPADFHVA